MLKADSSNSLSILNTILYALINFYCLCLGVDLCCLLLRTLVSTQPLNLLEKCTEYRNQDVESAWSFVEFFFCLIFGFLFCFGFAIPLEYVLKLAL